MGSFRYTPVMGTTMRRRDKEIQDRREIDRIIAEAQVCRLGLYDTDGVFIVPMSFAYDSSGSGTLYFHSAQAGRKIECIRRSHRASFEIDRMLELTARRPDEACTWSMSYESVMGYGRVSLVDDSTQKRAALDRIMHRYAGRGGWDYPDAMLQQTAIIRLDIEEVSGKRSPAARRVSGVEEVV